MSGWPFMMSNFQGIFSSCIPFCSFYHPAIPADGQLRLEMSVHGLPFTSIKSALDSARGGKDIEVGANKGQHCIILSSFRCLHSEVCLHVVNLCPGSGTLS